MEKSEERISILEKRVLTPEEIESMTARAVKVEEVKNENKEQ